jgi:lysozyme
MTLPLGIDFSNHQGNVDCQAVKASGKAFGFVKATEATWYDDGYFQQNWLNLRRVGLLRGAYHFLDATTTLGRMEAYYFLSRVRDWETGDIPIVDTEKNPAYAAIGVANWQAVIKRELGTPGVIYTSKGFADAANFGDVPQLAESGLWLASWGKAPGGLTLDDIPEPWKSKAGGLWAFHQYDANGQCPGVNGPCLLDCFNGTVDRIGLYGVR